MSRISEMFDSDRESFKNLNYKNTFFIIKLKAQNYIAKYLMDKCIYADKSGIRILL